MGVKAVIIFEGNSLCGQALEPLLWVSAVPRVCLWEGPFD